MNLPLKIIMIIIMTISGTFGALFLKKGIVKLKSLNPFSMIKIPELYIGVLFYLIGAAFNIVLLKYISYTILYPMTSLTYVWTLFVSFVVLKERINKNKLIAIASICAGVLVLGLSR